MDEQQKRMAEELLFGGGAKAPSFAKRLYAGEFESTIAFPYPQAESKIQQQEDEYIKKVQHFIDNEIDPDWIDRHAEIPQHVIQGLGRLGVLGMSIPAEHGGLGMTQRAYCRAAEALAGKCSSTALFVNAHQSVGLKALLLFGTQEQKSRWLAPLAHGEQLAAFSLTEPNAGSDAAGIETRAVFDKDANVYYITGTKQWTTNGSMAHILTVMAKMEVDTPQGKQDKITAFLVTPDMPGFKVTHAALEKVGMRGTKTSNLAFDNMPVPAANILGPIGGGLKVCLTVLDYGRTTFGATCTGVAKALVQRAVEYSRTRYQFKRPLASFGLVKKKLARMAALTYAMDAATYFTAGLIDRGAEDIMLESAMLKVFSSEAAWLILYDTMQIYGGRSFFTDHPFERVMRDSRLNMIGEGSNEVMRAFIGAVGMRDIGMQLKGYVEVLKNPIPNVKHLSSIFTQLFRHVRIPKIEVKSQQLQPQAIELGRAVRRFGHAVIKLLAYYREGIIEKQLELERIADSAIALYTASATLSKLDAGLTSGIEANPLEIEPGKLYIHMATEVVHQNLNNLFSRDDNAIESLSDKLTGIKSTW